MTELSLENLGWSSWFESQAVAGDGDSTFARVAAVDRDQFLLAGEAGFFRAKRSGKLLYDAPSLSQTPCVGDWVCVTKSPQDQFGMIHGVLDRKSYLRRRVAGDSADFQMIASNVDVVIVVQSCHYDFNINRLERYIVMAMDGGAIPVILLTKVDLVTPEVLADQINQIRNAGITEPVVPLSNVTGVGIENLTAILSPGKTYCFVGSSGVGKSTIINTLMGRDTLATQWVSATGEGKHTTVRRELLLLDNGAMVIDNPGMRELGMLDAEDGIQASFRDIQVLSAQCRFRDCTHTGEPGCAVQQAVERGEMDGDHYENYVKLKDESQFYQMSYAEKRKKDRDFGRFIKTAKKDLRKK
ncbi:MAG TPA: ribosome small subunit-dependent GTPase A [Thermoanaerobaculia bacterium]|nr:ribosome small subunit-dependent GTPase A [Thermoanaerobaculia bacterium]HUM31190.1 ribosome small subunit-dependent GTPase A [Thermoanaerobaculia bacterium]HXK69574.1 ribosome small subunit-dependent GTPase A [Thermoanaerobaculia bacterium]